MSHHTFEVTQAFNCTYDVVGDYTPEEAWQELLEGRGQAIDQSPAEILTTFAEATRGAQSNPRWNDNLVQFARLLAEIVATQDLDNETLCASMDLEQDDINELFERAQEMWEQIKAAVSGNPS
jgi:hypothetical protein